MPPRRKICNKIAVTPAMRKKKLIDNRLLQISIIVEDYIFEAKPIGRHEAEVYAKEVASYVDKCLGDERSLQVIEKLQRHMRSIIAEQGEPVDEDIFTQPLPGTTPPYPVLEDDMTHNKQDTEVENLTQGFDSLNFVEDPIKIGRNKRKATVKHNIRDNSQPDDDLTQFTQDTDIEDLTQEFNSLNSIQTPIKKARNNSKALNRNMRISYSIDDDMTQCTQDSDMNIDVQEINSQNSVNKPNTRTRNKRNAFVKRNIRKTKIQMNVSNNYNSDLDVIDICDDGDKAAGFNNSLNVEVTPQDKISSLYIPKTPSGFSVCSPSILNSFEAVQGISKSITEEVSAKPNAANILGTVKNVNESTKTLINKDIILKMELTDRKIPEKGKIPFPTKDNAIKENNNRKIMPINNIKKITNTRNVSNNQKTVNPIEILKNKVDKANNNSKVNKLKKGSSDLSWTENITYVREIAKEEYVNVLTPENFWDNYTLPEKWNDDDFLYN